MSAVVAPLYTAEREGRRLRAFAAEGSAPELPWFALADLAAALAVDREEEVELIFGLAAGNFGLALRTVVTHDGAVVLVDQPGAFLVLQLVGLLDGAPPTVPGACALFEDALNGGTVAAIAELSPAEAARWMRAAWDRGSVAIGANVERYRSGGEPQGLPLG